MSELPINVYAPPAIPGQLPVRRAAWPTAVGIVMIVIGTLGVLSNFCGSVIVPLMPWLFSLMQSQTKPDPMLQVQIDITQKYLPFILANALLLLGLGVVLLTAGIAVVRRRRAGTKLARFWAITRIAWALPASYFGYAMSMDSFDLMQKAAANSRQATPAGLMGFMQSMGIVGVVIGLVFVCALPTFVLIWFSHPKVKTETAHWQ